MWISFAHDLDPNNHGITKSFDGSHIPKWPVYAANVSDALNGYGVNYRFDQREKGLAIAEKDLWRAEALAYLIENSATVFGS
jgi:hypothetical protein